MNKNINILFIAVVGVLTFTIVAPRTVSAWVVGAWSWDLSGSSTLHYRANELPAGDWQNRLSDARWAWNNVQGASVELFRNDQSYKIRVYDGWIDGSDGVLGAVWRYGGPPHTTSADMKIDSWENWYTGVNNPAGNQYDLQSVFMHELGHALVIKHTNEACPWGGGPTMCDYLNTGQTHFRSLENDDEDALRFLYP